MSTDKTDKLVCRAAFHASDHLRTNIHLLVLWALIVMGGMFLFVRSPPWDLTNSGWSLSLAILATLILGGVLGYRARQSDNDLPPRMLVGAAFAVAWRIGAVWIALIGCVEFLVTAVTSPLLTSFATTSATVDHYPIILVGTVFIVSGALDARRPSSGDCARPPTDARSAGEHRDPVVHRVWLA